MTEHNIICFGETLWDVFPEQKKPGGAPMNVAVHLRRFGFEPALISRVGKDDLGNGLLDFLRNNGMDTQLIQQDEQHPTGVVNVRIGSSGDATYDIVYPSAWDFIDFSEVKSIGSQYQTTLVFGSLASRNDHSRDTLFRLLEQADTSLFDVNFRKPHYSRELVETLLLKSDIIKLNEDELLIIGSWLGVDGKNYETVSIEVAKKYSLDHIVVTLGSEGAMVFKNGRFYRQPGFRVVVQDTVGSGDSFLAAYLANFLSGKPVEACLEIACATGAFVASKNGAVPDYTVHDIYSFIDSN